MMTILVLLLFSLFLTKETIDINLGNSNYSIIVNSTLRNLFNVSTISSCGCSYNEIFYAPPNEDQLNFTLIPSDYSIELKTLKLLSNTNLHYSNYTIEKYSNNKTYTLHIKTQCFSKKNNSSILSNESKNDDPETVSNDKWSVIRFQFSYVNTDYYFEYIKFCEFDSKLLSITSSIAIFLIATVMLFLSTYMQINLQVIREVSEITEVKWYYAFIFVIIISCVLLLLFFFIKYMIIIYTLLFFFQSTMCLYYALKYFLKTLLLRFNPELNSKRYLSFKISDYISISIALTLVVIYYLTRHWVLNNVLAFGLVFSVLSLLLFKNFKVCFWFLLCIFLYDTFWVFFSEKVFNGDNVMSKVATSIKLPIKLEIPILFSTNPIKDCMLLGLGDIALPGLIVKYCKRFDSLSKTKHKYFLIALLLYVISVGLAMIMLFAFEHSQPVLFYISPMFIIGLMLKAYLHGELGLFWNGIEKKIKAIAVPQDGNNHIDNNHLEINNEREMEFKEVKLDHDN